MNRLLSLALRAAPVLLVCIAASCDGDEPAPPKGHGGAAGASGEAGAGGEPLCPPGAGTALSFDGVDDHVTMGVAPTLGLSRFTLETWFKRTGPGVSATSGVGGVIGIPLITKGRGEADGDNRDCNYFFSILAAKGVLAADFEDVALGTNHRVVGVTPILTDVWYHTAVTYDGNTWRLYLYGELEAEATVGEVPRYDSIQHFTLGTTINSVGELQGYFQGALDEVRVWDLARTQAEIQSGMMVEIDDAPGLVGRWSFEEGQGAVAGDDHGDNPGQITGATWVPGTPFEITYPPLPTAISPVEDEQTVVTSPTLAILVEDGDSPDHDVTFYGRKFVASDDFTVVVLPDTQYYSEGYPQTYLQQTQWIVDHQKELNIAFVVHAGDMVDYAPSEFQWGNADAAMSILEAPQASMPDGIPYCPAVGNHDQDPNGSPAGTTMYNTYFGEWRFQGRSYYGGHYGIDNDNNFSFFRAGGMDFIEISLEYDTSPSPGVLNWADTLLKAYPDHRAIVSSHYITDTGDPAPFSVQGQAIYDALKDNPNLFMLLCGHIAGEGKRVDTFDGTTVTTMLADYQGRSNGGDGWLRLLRFSPANDAVFVSTYSPKFEIYETDADSEFSFSYDMPGEPVESFVEIGKATAVPTGTSARLTWPDLSPGTTYEWYATASSCGVTKSTPPRKFTTGP